jgi:hypothetical protein
MGAHRERAPDRLGRERDVQTDSDCQRTVPSFVASTTVAHNEHLYISTFGHSTSHGFAAPTFGRGGIGAWAMRIRPKVGGTAAVSPFPKYESADLRRWPQIIWIIATDLIGHKNAQKDTKSFL